MGRDASESVVSVLCVFGKGRKRIGDVEIVEGDGGMEDSGREDGDREDGGREKGEEGESGLGHRYS